MTAVEQDFTTEHDATDDPPQDIEAERYVLGAMMHSADAVGEVVEAGLTAEHFYRPPHQVIYTKLVELYCDNSPTGEAALAHALGGKTLQMVGGAPYLHTCLATCVTTANVGHFVEIVQEKSTLRKLQQAGTQITQLGQRATGGGFEISEVIELAQAALDEVTETDVGDDYELASALVQGTLDELDAIQANGGPTDGIPTGFADFDALTHGLHPGQMIIAAGRPGQGKSTWGLDVARSASVKHGYASVIFSLEMSKAEIMQRVLSAEGGVRLSDMRGGHMTEQDWTRVSRAAGRVNDSKLFIDDSPGLTIPAIRAKARRLKQRHDIQLIVVDYLQLMSSGKRVESRQQEVSEFSRNLKLLAKELEVPVIAISQLNRGPEQRSDKKPLLSDLRESGSLEQDADLVVLLHRPDGYERDDPRMGEADFILAKHRAGPTGVVTVAHQLHYSRFVDMAREE